MMALGTISPEVVDSGVDSTGLERWCWIWLGLGTKKTRIVMAYQPSNSGQSAGTTVKDQQSRYFFALGDARSPRTIFYEQLVSQLISWKAIDNDIVLLGDFNKNVYSSWLACQLSQDDLNMTKICRCHMGIPIPPTFWRGSIPINGIFTTYHTRHQVRQHIYSPTLRWGGRPLMLHHWSLIQTGHWINISEYRLMRIEETALFLDKDDNGV